MGWWLAGVRALDSAVMPTRRGKRLEAQWFGDRFYVAIHNRRWGLFDVQSAEHRTGLPVLLSPRRADVTGEARRRSTGEETDAVRE